MLADWMTVGRQPVLRQVDGQPHLVPPDGKGIVDPVDDFRDSNPSANDELLDALAKDFVANKFDVKHLIRDDHELADLSAQRPDQRLQQGRQQVFLARRDQAADGRAAARRASARRRRCRRSSPACRWARGRCSCRTARSNHPFLKTFGQPARELACECERESDSNLAQALQLINGPTVNEKLRNANNRIGKLLGARSRRPGDPERAVPGHAVAAADDDGRRRRRWNTSPRRTDKRKAWEDVHWALLNTKEFLFRH